MKRLLAKGLAVFALFLILLNIYSQYNIKKNDSENFLFHILDYDWNLTEIQTKETEFIPTFKNINQINSIELIEKYVFNIDASAYVTESDLNLDKLANMNLKLNLKGDEPKILIFHTHSDEAFLDSRTGGDEYNESIVSVGDEFARVLADKYGISVVHDKGVYDIVNGKLARGESYENMEPAIEKILEKYPSIEVTIDLHRDGLPDDMHLVTNINGKETAKIMFFNGITKINKKGVAVSMPDLENPYIEENLAFSLQMFLKANELYPGLARKNYIKPYRYSLHFKQRSMLIELGGNTNTFEEAKNAVYPLADVLVQVLGEQE